MPNQQKGKTGNNYGTTTISDSLRTDAGLRVGDNLHEVSSREDATSGSPSSTANSILANRTTDTSNSDREFREENQGTDLDKLARAVAIAETSNCTQGYGLTHNNCHGIKKGKTYPCATKKGSKMCAFQTKEESFKAFKIIWAKWYKNPVPTMANANTWTGKDRAKTWLKHVKANL